VPESVGEIPLVLPFDVLQVSLESLLDANRQHRHPILLAFSSSDNNLMLIEVEVLHSQLQTFLQPHPGPIEQRHDNPHRPPHVREDGLDFLETEHNREAMWHFRP